MTRIILALDPGRDKIGFAFTDLDGLSVGFPAKSMGLSSTHRSLRSLSLSGGAHD